MPCIPETSGLLNVSRQLLAVAGVANLKPGKVNSYDNEVLMPLSEFIERPEALDLLHDGQVLQVRSGRTSALPMRLTAFQHCLDIESRRRCCMERADVGCLLDSLLGCQGCCSPAQATISTIPSLCCCRISAATIPGSYAGTVAWGFCLQLPINTNLAPSRGQAQRSSSAISTAAAEDSRSKFLPCFASQACQPPDAGVGADPVLPLARGHASTALRPAVVTAAGAGQPDGQEAPARLPACRPH